MEVPGLLDNDTLSLLNSVDATMLRRLNGYRYYGYREIVDSHCKGLYTVFLANMTQ